MIHGSLFSGIGGFDLAAEWMGWTNLFHCEYNPFSQKVLKHHFPNAKPHGDITKTDFTIYRGQCDIVTGGFPCQPYSQAGKRLGKEDERHLWPEMLRAIKEIQPSWIVGENVSGLLNWNGGMVLNEIKTDLESAGFEVIPPCVLPACGVNAPHRRDRVWIVAFNAKYDKLNKERRIWERSHNESRRICKKTNVTANAENFRSAFIDLGKQESEQQIQTRDDLNGCNGTRDVANSSDEGLQGSKIHGGIRGIRKNGNEQLAGCVPSTWENFPTQSPLCNGNDGLSSRLDGITFSKWRNESIKAGGNAIVPQVAFEIFKSIQQYENKIK